jgi:hypothetical protein
MKNPWDFLISWMWKPLWRYNKAVAISVLILIGVAILEAAQSGFLGDSAYRAAARFVPWQPWFASQRATHAIHKIRTPGSTESSFMTNGQRCPLGSEIAIAYTRTGNGWIAAVGYNRVQGYYSVTAHGFKAVEIEKGTEYHAGFTVTSTVGEELIFIIGSNKPFDVKHDFDPLLQKTRLAAKGGELDLAGSLSGHFDVAPVMTCIS